MNICSVHSKTDGDANGKADAPSLAPAGTVFTGLSIYKDKPDPVALPDNQYPEWLFELLDDPAINQSKALMVGDVDTTGMSKGEARSALKRSAKMARAAAKKQAALEAKEKQRLERMTDAQRAAALKATEKAAEEAVPKTPSDWFAKERSERRALRKSSRASIKASNFVRAA
ncbi:Uncharacterized protein MSYG_1449 [Malassezia sympodialis ATCC 42132]|uniref:Large ribosomal subunit protein mL54 n=1 Tax=Malassezia sympodialis (strain ATCC 42132) TaxID=1230383 RepID=A0A1M8A3Z4_MALS4|nr:Uncharacterized protein MSYG_1449 [Malassezia sympodialis ATCC 42132]